MKNARLLRRGSEFYVPEISTTAKSSNVPSSEWLTAAEAAAYLKVKKRTLLLWVRQGKIPANALSGTKRRVWRFRQFDLDKALMAKPMVCCAPPAVLNEERRLN